jgi:hypothetical protein
MPDRAVEGGHADRSTLAELERAHRTSWRCYARHSLGLKAPRGWGWITNPRKAAYNRIYSRTSLDLFKPRRGCGGSVLGGLLAVGIVGLLLRACGG